MPWGVGVPDRYVLLTQQSPQGQEGEMEQGMGWAEPAK